jgi:hypothetical protein
MNSVGMLEFGSWGPDLPWEMAFDIAYALDTGAPNMRMITIGGVSIGAAIQGLSGKLL